MLTMTFEETHVQLKSTKEKSFQLLNHVQPMEITSIVLIEGTSNQLVEETNIDD